MKASKKPDFGAAHVPVRSAPSWKHSMGNSSMSSLGVVHVSIYSLSRQDMHYFHTCLVNSSSVPPHTKQCAGSCHPGTGLRNTWLSNSSNSTPDNFLRCKICGSPSVWKYSLPQTPWAEQHSSSDSQGKWSRGDGALGSVGCSSLVHSLGQQQT